MNNLTNTTFRLCFDLTEIKENSWNRCAGSDNPFTSYNFLNALEKSGCVSQKTGWQPCHIILENQKKTIIACAPMYVKNHSFGEYVFDHAWANAYEKAGGKYYPKLLIAVPFTPVTGNRLLIRSKSKKELMKKALLDAAINTAKKNNMSSVNINFASSNEFNNIDQENFLQRIGEQFHWKNNVYKNFYEFVSQLSSRKRKAILKERKKAVEPGVEILRINGNDISEKQWDAFYRFYINTSERKWGQAYLNRDFFRLIGQTMPENILLILAKKDDEYLAGALNFIGSDTLYGRYWGCLKTHQFLHFEICYYQAIDFAIENNLLNVEAGAQGTHKLSRGYLPNKTYSMHWISNDSFRNALKEFLLYEGKAVRENLQIYNEFSPFKKIH